jgi:hypothetical protein
MPTVTNYQIEIPMYGLVDYVSIQYSDDYAISMPKADYDAQQAAQATLPSNSSIPQAGE